MDKFFMDKPYPDEKVGTEYIVTSNGSIVDKGKKVYLLENDGSSCPWFRLCGENTNEWCISWERLTRLENKIIIGGKLL